MSTGIHNRQNPSPRYRELLALYDQMHREGGDTKSGSETFAGGSLLPHLPAIRALALQTGARSLLDYGSGKGVLYRQRNISLTNGDVVPSVAEYLGVERIVCYEPAYSEYSKFPEEQFDGVISTDVLEHCPEPDIPWIVDEIFASARKFVFANVACYPAEKSLPNGENAHCTQRPATWWRQVLRDVAARHPGVIYRWDITEKRDGLFNRIMGRRRVVSTIAGQAANAP